MRMRIRGSGMGKSGSGINIPDPQHYWSDPNIPSSLLTLASDGRKGRQRVPVEAALPRPHGGAPLPALLLLLLLLLGQRQARRLHGGRGTVRRNGDPRNSSCKP
jgi:hypothetical protein